MVDHFRAIGIEAPYEELFEHIVQESTEEWRSKEGVYRRWTDSSGAAVYLTLDASGSLSCVTPFFAPADGLARIRVKTSAPLDDGSCPHCGGTDCDILDEQGELLSRTAVQWAMYQPYRDWLEGERSFEMELVVFAHQIEVFPDEAAFAASTAAVLGKGEDGEPIRIAANAFMPWGIFSEGNDLGERAIARVNGKIVAASLRRNGLTGQSFWQIRVASCIGQVDVVAAIEWIDGEPKAGGQLVVDGWIVGRPAPQARALRVERPLDA